jgi:predicted amidohydrolase
MVQAYAGLYTCFLVYGNRVGYEDGACFWGGSQIVSPAGQVLAKARYLDEELVEAELEPGSLRRARISNPLLRDERLELTLQEVQRLLRVRMESP